MHAGRTAAKTQAEQQTAKGPQALLKSPSEFPKRFSFSTLLYTFRIHDPAETRFLGTKYAYNRFNPQFTTCCRKSQQKERYAIIRRVCAVRETGMER